MGQDRQKPENILHDVITAARTGDYGKAASDLNRALVLLQTELSGGKVSSEGLAKITYSLQTLLAMQQIGDWVAFADVLEYEFIALWKSLVPDRN
ncbi:MAG TPA: hypothetical protein PLE24_13850 [Chitinispirillaceae bacterium]|jgi:hypothetical protein|nr:hypothetical protein [Chitinispirillaceae bacterium]